MLITGEPHCDQDRLARIVHAISLFRERPLVALGRVPAAPGTPDTEGAQRDLALERAVTVLLDLNGHAAPLEPALTSRLFSPRYQTRVIALARTTSVANAALGEHHVKQMTHVRLEPLSRRPGAIHRLLDGMLQERGSSLRVEAMTRHRRHYDMRATFITLALEDGADADVLEHRVTHTKKRRSAFDGYDRGVRWAKTCAEVAKLRISRRHPDRVTARVTVLGTQRKHEENVVEVAGVEGHDVDAPRRSRQGSSRGSGGARRAERRRASWRGGGS
jgi:hypothetical protein